MDKKEIFIETLKFIKQNPHTQFAEIKRNIESILKARGIIGEKREHIGGGILTRNIRTPDETALKINEVFYDLLYKERILTPGINDDNLNLPFVHVSDMDRLEELLKND
ncbi:MULTISPECIES: hypothetical protein [unclassified Priestia]|uniref:hypothetical protein n=1 Tax=unclassified Priestia TaxID=2800374 RepID=UPI003672C748